MVTFTPIYQPRVWGGRALHSLLGRNLPEDGPIGESWEIVDRGPLQSIVQEGPHAGKTLRALIEEDPTGVMGENWDPSIPFPLLVKWLDCQQRMSVQVHPPESAARRLGGQPKTEAWMIVQADTTAHAYLGLNAPTTAQALRQSIANGSIESLLHKVALKTGDTALVPSGRIHALGGGSLILEIQQNSDTTYRVYDWGRTDANGQPRALHIDEALQCIDFNDVAPGLDIPQGDTIAQCAHFRIRKQTLQGGQTLKLSAQGKPWIVTVLSGAIRDAQLGVLTHGKNGLIFARESIEWSADTTTELVVTDSFA